LNDLIIDSAIITRFFIWNKYNSKIYF